MHKRSVTLMTLAAVVTTAGCAIAPARMALPAPLETEQAFAFEGMTFGQQGRFEAGPYRVSYTRTDTRLALFDSVDERRSGRTSFALQGPGIEGEINADCRVAERTITLGIISFTPKPMAYQCRFFEEGRAMPARFEVQEERSGLAGMLMRQSRRGEIDFGGVVLQIASVHRLEGSGIETSTPVGYVFEEQGVPAGAVELNGRPTVRFDSGVDLHTRRAVMIAATALGLLWDPANSPLGRDGK